MVSATNTEKKKTKKRRRFGLTFRIFTLNVVSLLILVFGILHIGQYRDGLIRAELEKLQVQAQLFAGAVAEAAIRPVEQGKPFLFAKPEEIETLIPQLSQRVVRRLADSTNSRTRLFDINGNLINDSHKKGGPGSVIQVDSLQQPEDEITFSVLLAYLIAKTLELVPEQRELPLYPYTTSERIGFYPDAANALTGQISASAWQTEKGKMILTAAAPVQNVKQTLGVIMLTVDGENIENEMTRVRFDVFFVFLSAFFITVLISLYLAGIIARPLKKLAHAAESIRLGKSREIDIPDLGHRNDEIGELSLALNAMTDALWDRMDSIEAFAADVSHELKNPLTSVRSAVETIAKVKKEADRKRLLDIVLNDVQRLDRLITDISKASRLDAELSRDDMGDVDFATLLKNLCDSYKNPIDRANAAETETQVVLDLPARRDVTVHGNETRLVQVFENLISNALSFSPEKGKVFVRVIPGDDTIKVTVQDEGPGIPETKLETIFERFYSERPKHETFGNHSGLGLSIVRQIIKSHGGEIYADNIKNAKGEIQGASFTVILRAA